MRLHEHERATTNEDPTSGVSAHVLNTGHRIGWERATIIVQSNSKSKQHLRTLESLAMKIQNQQTPLMNLAPPHYPSAQSLVHPTLASNLALKWDSEQSRSLPRDQNEQNGRVEFQNKQTILSDDVILSVQTTHKSFA